MGTDTQLQGALADARLEHLPAGGQVTLLAELGDAQHADVAEAAGREMCSRQPMPVRQPGEGQGEAVIVLLVTGGFAVLAGRRIRGFGRGVGG